MAPQRSRPPTMLVVDDERAITELLDLWFGGLGWNVVSAASGPEGLATTTAVDPDIVILDVLLPGFTGHEVLRRLRAMGSTTPVIITTALDELDPAHPAKDVAPLAQALVPKPYSLVVLEATVNELYGSALRGTIRA